MENHHVSWENPLFFNGDFPYSDVKLPQGNHPKSTMFMGKMRKSTILDFGVSDFQTIQDLVSQDS